MKKKKKTVLLEIQHGYRINGIICQRIHFAVNVYNDTFMVIKRLNAINKERRSQDFECSKKLIARRIHFAKDVHFTVSIEKKKRKVRLKKRRQRS